MINSSSSRRKDVGVDSKQNRNTPLKLKRFLGIRKPSISEPRLNGELVDFAFVDGSHSYDYVKNDTEKLLRLLAPSGVIVWHDYCRAWPGVVRYLNELGTTLPLRYVDGTTLVYLKRTGGEK